MSDAAANLYSALDPDLKNRVTANIDKIAKSIETDRNVRMWRLDAERVSSLKLCLIIF